MFKTRHIGVLLVVILAIAWQADLSATRLLHMNLDEMCQRSDRIGVATLLSVSETTVQGGGGTLPAVAYRMHVTQPLKGQFNQVKGEFILEFKMVGTLAMAKSGRAPLPGMAVLRKGQQYLILLAPDGPIGLTSTMGLAQGCFVISGKAGSETALNGFNNAGLFNGMSAPGMPGSGPVDLAALVSMIQAVGGGN